MKTETGSVKRLDHLICEQERDSTTLETHARSSIKAFKLAKTTAFRMAKRYLRIQDSYHNELLDWVKPKYPKTNDPISAWVEEMFAPFTLLGEDPWALIKAVSDGMTCEKYRRMTPALFLNENKRNQGGDVNTSHAPSAPPETLSIAEQCEQWRKRSESFEMKWRDATKRLRLAEQRIVILEKDIKRVQRVVRA